MPDSDSPDSSSSSSSNSGPATAEELEHSTTSHVFRFAGLFYAMLALLMIALSWTLPGITTGGAITYTLLGVVILIAGALQAVSSAELLQTLCTPGGAI